MKNTFRYLAYGLLSGALSFAVFAHDNQLTEQEKAQGWQLLFDGKTMSNWRNFKQPGLSDKWRVIDGKMVLTGKGGGDILTKQRYLNFELKLEWQVSEVGNSGIFIMADENGQHIYSHAVEVQILDNERHPDNKLASHLSGSIYDLVAAPKASHKVAGQWNQVRIYFNESHLKVWQNQVLTTDILVGGERWQQLVKASKFATWQGFAQTQLGHIGLQDHGDLVSFKNIKIKVL